MIVLATEYNGNLEDNVGNLPAEPNVHRTMQTDNRIQTQIDKQNCDI